MGSDSIHPPEAMGEYLQLLKERDAPLLLPGTEDFRPEFLEDIPCPLCGGENLISLFPVRNVFMVRCGDCTLVYVNPRFRRDELERLHDGSAAYRYFYEKILLPTTDFRILNIFLPRVRRIEATVKNLSGKLLDIGFGPGQFLELAAEQGWETEGVETNGAAIELFRQRNPTVKLHKGRVEELNLQPGGYQVITLWETLEHLHDPLGMLKGIHALLEKGGWFFLTTPNIEGFEYKALGSRGRIDPLNHIVWFNPQTLRRILEETGFTNITVESVGMFDLDFVLDSIKNHPSSGVVDAWLLNIEKEPIFADFKKDFAALLNKYKIGGNLFAYARKQR